MQLLLGTWLTCSFSFVSLESKDQEGRRVGGGLRLRKGNLSTPTKPPQIAILQTLWMLKGTFALLFRKENVQKLGFEKEIGSRMEDMGEEDTLRCI